MSGTFSLNGNIFVGRISLKLPNSIEGGMTDISINVSQRVCTVSPWSNASSKGHVFALGEIANTSPHHFFLKPPVHKRPLEEMVPKVDSLLIRNQ